MSDSALAAADVGVVDAKVLLRVLAQVKERISRPECRSSGLLWSLRFGPGYRNRRTVVDGRRLS